MSAPYPKQQLSFDGLGVSSGIAFGTAFVSDASHHDISRYHLEDADIPAELTRLQTALDRARDQLAKMKQKANDLPESAAEELSYLLDAHIQMLKGSRLIRGIEHRITAEHLNAEAAVQDETENIVATFKALDDAYIASRQSDVQQVARRLIRTLQDKQAPNLSNIAENTLIIAEDLTPADTAQLDPHFVRGFATVLGGPESHTAIMARALELPAVLGVAGLIGKIHTGDPLIIDGDQGKIIANPTQETITYYQGRAKSVAHQRAVLSALKSRKAETKDGTALTLQANIELPQELNQALNHGAQGVGLLRSEFMYMNRDSLPDEEEQYQVFKTIVDAMQGQTVTIRTLDIGGDKIARSLIDDFGDSICSPLGLRGVRLSLNRRDILATQLRAILRASCHGPVRILLPMVTTAGEVRRVKSFVCDTAEDLRAAGVKLPDHLPPIGAMIEVPGAALSADALARVCDFFAIGSNDLTMYTLATDRADEQVAALYDPLHPAVLRLIQFTTQAAQRNDVPVSLCGEIAGNPRFSALLVGLGIHTLSMSAPNIGRVKQRVLSLDSMACTQRANQIMDQSDRGRIAMMLDDFNEQAL